MNNHSYSRLSVWTSRFFASWFVFCAILGVASLAGIAWVTYLLLQHFGVIG